jgi:cyclic pyranopterin phosphate synthase
MSESTLRFIDQRSLQASLATPALPLPPLIPPTLREPDGHLQDQFQRPLHDLRISVTDRCNFRCTYCMPKQVFDKDYVFLPQTSLLSFEEITRLARLFIAHGVEKIRITGGEPLLRKNIEKLISMLSELQTLSGKPLDLTLTTNGSLLAKKARALKDAGLQRVTVSLDALSEAAFQKMNDVDFPVADVLNGIHTAHQLGLGPIKVNMVVKKGSNDQEIISMARYFKDTPFILRFIEYMDVGASNGWKMDQVIPSSEVIARIHAEMPLQAIAANYPGETASRWRYLDGHGNEGGEIGVISSVSQAFCHECSRIRLSTEGKLYTCLFASQGHDLRSLLRTGQDDLSLSNAIAHIWQSRTDRYSALRSSASAPLKKVEMSYIGG